MGYLKNLLVITIGESPRDDITPMLEKYLTHVKIDQVGLLDNLDVDEMQMITKVEGNKILVSRKRNGNSVLLNGEVVEKQLEEKIHQASENNHENILLLCTGEFDQISQKHVNLFIPDKIITPLIANIFPNKKMGLLIPNQDQISMMNSKWAKQGLTPCIGYASPYSSISEIIVSCKKLEKSGVDFILMDCMGYTEEMKDEVIKKINIPVVSSNSLLIKILTEVL